MGDVIQHLIDGTSGIAPGGVDGKALVAGVCSKGRVGKAYLIGKRSDLEAMLGQGPLVERVREMLDTGRNRTSWLFRFRDSPAAISRNHSWMEPGRRRGFLAIRPKTPM